MAFLVNSVSIGQCCGTLNGYVEAEWSSDQNGYAPPANYSLIHVSSDAPVSVFGLDLTAGRVVTLVNDGTYPITFVDESGSATSTAMRLDTPQDVDVVLEPGHSVTFRADPSTVADPRVRLLETTVAVGSLLGTTGSTSSVGTEVGSLTVEGSSATFVSVVKADDAEVTLALVGYGDQAAESPALYVLRARDVEGSADVVQSGDRLFALTVLGFDGTDFATAARLIAEVAGTPGSNDMPGRWSLQTSPDGSQTPAERLGVESTGELKIGTDGYLSFDRHSGTPATPAAGRDVLYVDGAGVVKKLDSAGAASPVGAPSTPPTTIALTAVPTWYLVGTITHADLNDADTEEDEVAYVLPAKAAVMGVIFRTKTVGSGGGVAGLTLSFLIAGTLQSTGVGNGLVANDLEGQGWPTDFTGKKAAISWSATTDLGVRFNSVGCNLADLTGGEWEVYLLLCTMG